MSKRTSTGAASKPAADPSLRQRAARLRDAAGRFVKRPLPAQEAAAPQQQSTPSAPPPAPQGWVPAPHDAPDGTYALRVDEDGLGLHAPPGASILAAPIPPTGAGLAVFYLKDRPRPTIFDLTHHFTPEDAQPFAPGSTVVPVIEVVSPITGRRGRIDADRIEKLHRVVGVYVPIKIGTEHRRVPAPLPVMAACPEGMGEHYVDDASAYPAARGGETVIYDPSRREPIDGALCVLQWNSGSRSVLLTNRRPRQGDGDETWFVDPVNRPSNSAMMDRRLASGVRGTLYASDGPYSEALLREKIVGTVVGILVPWHRETAEPGTELHAEPEPAAEPSRTETADEIRAATVRTREAAAASALDDAGLTSEVSPAMRAVIVRHGEVMEATKFRGDETDEDIDRDAEQQIEAEAAVANLPAQSLADLRGKLTYLLPLIEPDMLDLTHVEYLRAIRDDADRLCRGTSSLATLTMAELAALPFEPLDRASPCPVPTREDWIREADTLLPWLRVGFALLGSDKDKLPEMIGDLELIEGGAMVETLIVAERNFEQLLRFTRDVMLRMEVGYELIARRQAAASAPLASR